MIIMPCLIIAEGFADKMFVSLAEYTRLPPRNLNLCDIIVQLYAKVSILSQRRGKQCFSCKHIPMIKVLCYVLCFSLPSFVVCVHNNCYVFSLYPIQSISVTILFLIMKWPQCHILLLKSCKANLIETSRSLVFCFFLSFFLYFSCLSLVGSTSEENYFFGKKIISV